MDKWMGEWMTGCLGEGVIGKITFLKFLINGITCTYYKCFLKSNDYMSDS